MTIHREGIKTIMITAILFGAVNLASFYFLSYNYPWVSWIIFLVSIIFWLFIISFFRVPSRNFVVNEEYIVAPADGKVVVIEEAYDEEYFKDKRLQISIFMSPANVHQNRNPISGEVARRIVNYLKVGQKADQAAEMGFIKFGSRVDVLLPVGSQVEVKLNQVV